jgi:PncC family amidohydrolase
MNVADSDLHELCAYVAELLADSDRRVVFAESCTAGLVSALLAGIPGISRYLCGSAVTYREDTKTQWLGVSEEVLEEHSAVSEAATASMARGVLANTPEANLAASVTGHLGPDAPVEQDGVVFVAVAMRSFENGNIAISMVNEYRLQADDRLSRQREAVLRVLACLRQTLEDERRTLSAGRGSP